MSCGAICTTPGCNSYALEFGLCLECLKKRQAQAALKQVCADVIREKRERMDGA